jgi:hypothetical protein
LKNLQQFSGINEETLGAFGRSKKGILEVDISPSGDAASMAMMEPVRDGSEYNSKDSSEERFARDIVPTGPEVTWNW